MNIIKSDYGDIIKEVLPSNMESYDLQKANDIKSVKNHL